MKLKIGILTQPLHTNYGGLLQAYALQKVLRDGGHDVLTIDYGRNTKWWTFPYRLARRIVGKFLLRRGGPIFPPKNFAEIRIHTERFIRENIKTTDKIYAPASQKDFEKYGFDAYVVGSDQTWRPAYSPWMPTFFLDFLDGNDTQTLRIAYASSFGESEWKFSPAMTRKCAALAKKFCAISVREDSGILLCEKYLGVPAKHVLDPTMLLDKEDYCKLIAADESRGLLSEGGAGRDKTLFAYILDRTPEKMAILKKIARERGLKIAEVMPKSETTDRDAKLCDCVFPPVTEFLRGFRDAEFVVTDSFHGTVFSIIFNRPFISIGNVARGYARFSSILKMFDLESRLVDATATVLPSAEIDWGKVNKLREKYKVAASDFLACALEQD